MPSQFNDIIRGDLWSQQFQPTEGITYDIASTNNGIIETAQFHGFATNDRVNLMTNINGVIINHGNYAVTFIDSTHFSLQGFVNGTIMGQTGECAKCLDGSGYTVEAKIKNSQGDTGTALCVPVLTWDTRTDFLFTLSITPANTAALFPKVGTYHMSVRWYANANAIKTYIMDNITVKNAAANL